MSNDPHIARLLEPNEVLAGKYKIVRLIGEGGMGAVFEAVHVRLGQRFAIKTLQPRLVDRGEVRSRFEREARAASQIKGANVARVVDVDVTPGGMPYMVMDYLEGHDLSAELAARSRLPIDEAVDYVLQACSAMAQAHGMGIIHRDLKPSNLFLCEENGQTVVKVLDFGISKVTNEADAFVTSTEMSIGTPVYMSPEQIRSAKHVDARTDIWALGVILYEMIAGKPPFVGAPTAVAAAIVADDVEPLSSMRPEVDPALEAAVHKALAKKVDARFADIGAFSVALLPFATSQGRHKAETSGSHPRLAVPRPSIANDATLPAAAAPLSAQAMLTSAPWTARAATGGAPASRSRWVLIGGIVAGFAIVGGGIAFYLSRQPTNMPAPTSSAAASVTESKKPAPVESIATVVPKDSASQIAPPIPKPTLGVPTPPTPPISTKTKPPPSADPKPPPFVPKPPPKPTDDPTHL